MKKKRKYTPENITSLKSNEIFVFGSNTMGIHGGGAAFTAREKFGAIYGQARGLQGQSYAIVTKNLAKGNKSIPLFRILRELKTLMDIAKDTPDKKYFVTKMGSCLAGYSISQMKSIFEKLTEIPNNIILPKEYETRKN